MQQCIRNINCCFFFHLKGCRGIHAWNYFSWPNWRSWEDASTLLTVSYKKQRHDTYLRAAFHSSIGQYYHEGCSRWSIQFNGQDCTDPSPIASLVFNNGTARSNAWRIAPAEISGFCYSSSGRSTTFGVGNVSVSVHVGRCVLSKSKTPMHGDAHTGTPVEVVQSTSSLVVEEYCPLPDN